jgi:hypothetical protein
VREACEECVGLAQQVRQHLRGPGADVRIGHDGPGADVPAVADKAKPGADAANQSVAALITVRRV